MPLPKPQYHNFLRVVRHSSSENAKSIRAATEAALERLGVKRDEKQAVTNTPDGSDQVNIGDLVAWTRKLKKDDKEGVKQLVAIDATTLLRN